MDEVGDNEKSPEDDRNFLFEGKNGIDIKAIILKG